MGTANAIELRHFSAQPAPATKPASTTPTGPQGAGAPANVPPTTPPGAAQAPNGAQAPASFAFDPPTVTAAKGGTFSLNVMLSGGQNVYSVPIQLNYDPNAVQLANVSNGTLLSQDGQAVALVHRDDPTSGTVQITATRPPGASGVTGAGSVVTLTFQAKTAGQSTVVITRGGARDPAMQAITVNGALATVNVQ